MTVSGEPGPGAGPPGVRVAGAAVADATIERSGGPLQEVSIRVHPPAVDCTQNAGAPAQAPSLYSLASANVLGFGTA
jgi:hypothetical protein